MSVIQQRPTRIARLHGHADLKIARVIPRPGQRRDFPLGQLVREPRKNQFLLNYGIILDNIFHQLTLIS